MLIGSTKVIFGLVAVALPTAVFVFAAISMVATSWRNWFGLQKKEEPHQPKTAAKPPPAKRPWLHPPHE